MNMTPQISRRLALQRVGFGMGAMAASDLLAGMGEAESPLAFRPPQFPAKAKRVIHLFMNGGPSQIDTFDPKPSLVKLDGKELPDSVKQTLQPTQRKRAGTISLQVLQARRVWDGDFRTLSERGQARGQVVCGAFDAERDRESFARLAHDELR